MSIHKTPLYLLPQGIRFALFLSSVLEPGSLRITWEYKPEPIFIDTADATRLKYNQQHKEMVLSDACICLLALA